MSNPNEEKPENPKWTQAATDKTISAIAKIGGVADGSVLADGYKSQGDRTDDNIASPKVSSLLGHNTYPSGITGDPLGFVNYMPYAHGNPQAGSKSESHKGGTFTKNDGPLQINLHMPPDLTDSVSAKWEEEEDLFAQASKLGLAKTIANKGIQFGQKAVTEVMGVASLGMLDGEAIKQSFERQAGKAVRPFESQFFKGVEYRTFDFQHKLIAFSQADTVTISKIIKLFRYYSSPGIAELGGHYTYPASWRIRFFQAADASGKSSVKESKWLPTLKRCILEKVEVKSFASDTPSYHTNLAPVDVDISLSFKEMEYVTRRDIEKENQPQW